MPRSAALPPRPRRLGPVNWLGLWTLYRRELKRVLQEYRDTVLGPAAAALLFLAVFHLALGERAGVPGGVTYLQFLVPGLVMIACCERAFETTAVSILFDKMEGMIADTVMAPLSAAERMLGYAASAATAGLVTALATLAGLLLFVDLPVTAPAAILGFAAAGALLHALAGILVGLWATRWDHYAAALTFLILPLAFLSGSFFPIRELPAAGQLLVSVNPVLYIVDGVRYGFTGTAERSLAMGALLLGGCILALGLLAWRLLARGYKVKP